jgi:hypothetical protein
VHAFRHTVALPVKSSGADVPILRTPSCLRKVDQAVPVDCGPQLVVMMADTTPYRENQVAALALMQASEVVD